jgi:hypothetical protein
VGAVGVVGVWLMIDPGIVLVMRELSCWELRKEREWDMVACEPWVAGIFGW